MRGLSVESGIDLFPSLVELVELWRWWAGGWNHDDLEEIVGAFILDSPSPL